MPPTEAIGTCDCCGFTIWEGEPYVVTELTLHGETNAIQEVCHADCEGVANERL